MKKSTSIALLMFLHSWTGAVQAQVGAEFDPPQVLTNKEIFLKLSAPAGQPWRIETSSDLTHWDGLATLLTGAINQQTDSGAPFLDARFYRANLLSQSDVVTGDLLATSDGEVTIHPINHATFIMTWHDKVIYADPVGGAARFQGLPRADLILVTHSHTDHFDVGTLNAVKGPNAVILAPLAVYQSLTASLKSIATVLTNGSGTNWLGVSIEAVPAYNLTSTYHPKGTGNGYILTIGGKRIYLTGDTEDIPEIRALQNIDVAFVCMNLPYTMAVNKAANIVRGFQPKVVYPYHYSGSDVNQFKQLVGTDRSIEVRLRKWY